MRPAGCELETYELYFILAYGGFCHSSCAQHTVSACLLRPAQDVKARTYDVLMMTVNENKLPTLAFFLSLNIHKLKTIFQTKTVSGLSYMPSSRKTRCLMHLISA